MINAERVSEQITETLQAELHRLEQRNDELTKRLREILSEDAFAEMQDAFDELVEVTHELIIAREAYEAYVVVLEEQLREVKQTPRGKRPDTIGGSNGSES